MIVLSESLLQEGVPQRDPLTIPRDLVHNTSMHFTFNKFWKRYGKFARHLMKVCSNIPLYCFLYSNNITKNNFFSIMRLQAV